MLPKARRAPGVRMHPPQSPLVGLAILVVLVGAPIAFAIAGWLRMRHEPRAPRVAEASSIATSMLLYIVAFNATFFVQELFLVVPKALTPGLDPILFHNNHTWRGTHPLENLFQGTGALATLVMATACWFAARRPRTTGMRMLLLWLAYCGWFMALPQIVVGAIAPGSDVGRAMDWFAMPVAVKLTLAFVALAAIPPLAIALARRVLALSPRPLATARARMRFVFAYATLPALLAIAPIIAYRVHREWMEVVMLPVVVAFAGLGWMQATAWRHAAAGGHVRPLRGWITALVAALAILAFFQLVLRRGVPF
jgi:hypothetical protein